VLFGDDKFMTDFLTRLVNRTLGLTPVVQPLIPSMYESGATVSSSGFAERDRVSEMPMSRTIPAESETSLTQDGIYSEISPLLISPQLAGEDMSKGEAQLADDDLNNRAKIVDELSVKVRIDSTNTITDNPSISHPVKQSPVEELRAGEIGENALSENISRKSSNIIAPASTDFSDRIESRDRDNSPTNDRHQLGEIIHQAAPNERSNKSVNKQPQAVEDSELLLTPNSSDFHPFVERHQIRNQPTDIPRQGEFNQPMLEEAEIGEKATTIRVHIGRIEVKAIQQTPIASASSGKPPVPKLSLDDYLKFRNGGYQK
jgi:hypothetical protein